jgi:putative endonuclease
MKTNSGSWFLYVVQCSDNTLYTGVTTDVSRRVHEHNTTTRGAKYTKTRRPVKLVYWIDFENRSTAQKAECRFKKLTRAQKEKAIKGRKMFPIERHNYLNEDHKEKTPTDDSRDGSA